MSPGLVTELQGGLLTEILVKMESRSDRLERYIRILSPPNLHWRYSGIVTICQGGRAITALSRPHPPGMVLEGQGDSVIPRAGLRSPTGFLGVGDLSKATLPTAGSGQLYIPRMRRRQAQTPRPVPEEHKSPVGKEKHGTTRKNWEKMDPTAAQH